MQLPPNERPLPLAELAKRAKRELGIDRDWDTWYRWCFRRTQNGRDIGGVLNRSTGKRVYLEWCREGGVVHSSWEAYQRFRVKQSEEV